jgi:hypothetical protein
LRKKPLRADDPRRGWGTWRVNPAFSRASIASILVLDLEATNATSTARLKPSGTIGGRRFELKA